MRIITTVGTSLITNYLNPDKNTDINKNFKSYFKNKLQDKEFSDSIWKSLQNEDYFKKFKKQLLEELKKDNSCAEKSTLDKIKKNNDEIFLLTTYTIDGYFVGNLLADYYNVKAENLMIIEGLQVH